jgi:hypothetical protein
MWMMEASYRGRGDFARLFCDLASPNASANGTLALGSGVSRAVKEGGPERIGGRHNYTVIALTSPNLRGRPNLAALGLRGKLPPRQQ